MVVALDLVASWPVDHAAAAVIDARGARQAGDRDRSFRLASLAKVITAWAVMVGVEEGIVRLDEPVRHVAAPPLATLRHLLSHAAGLSFDGTAPALGVGRRRIYSNPGIELAAAELAAAAEMPFAQYLDEAVLAPLGMADTTLHGSPAHAMWSTLGDMVRFVGEMRRPRLVAAATHAEMTSPQFPDLAGSVPDVGRFDPCPWGLGVEIRGDKSPHWTGRANSPATFGHFGGAGTMMWVDPVADVGVVALTDKMFDEWRADALRLWPEFSDAVLAESAAHHEAAG